MDLATAGGLLIAAVSMIVTVYWEGSHLSSLFGPSALLLIIGGTLGATMMSHSLQEVVQLPRVILQGFFPKRPDPLPLIDKMVQLAEKARRQGLLALQDEVAGAGHPLIARGLSLVVDGFDPEAIREVLEAQLAIEEKRARALPAMLETAGGYAPTIGIIGTVMGLVHVLSNLSDADKLGGAIAVAFLATFYGIATANLFWLPLAAKVKRQVEEETLLGEMLIAGIVALQTGENPRTLREKLVVFVPRHAASAAAKQGVAA